MRRRYNDLQRQQRYEREAGPPDAVCLSYTHDKDYLVYRDKPAAAAKMTRRAWCPPNFAAHVGAPSATRRQDEGGARGRRRAALLRNAMLDGEGDAGEMALVASASSAEEEEEEAAAEEEATDADARELQRVLKEIVPPDDPSWRAFDGASGGGRDASVLSPPPPPIDAELEMMLETGGVGPLA